MATVRRAVGGGARQAMHDGVAAAHVPDVDPRLQSRPRRTTRHQVRQGATLPARRPAIAAGSSARIGQVTLNTFITSSPRWLITFTAMRPRDGFGNGRDVSL